MKGKQVCLKRRCTEKPQNHKENVIEGSSIEDYEKAPIIPTNVVSGITTDTIRRGKARRGGALGGLKKALHDIKLPVKPKTKNIVFN
jgi:hypothetical protein